MTIDKAAYADQLVDGLSQLDGDSRALRIATEDAREFIKRAKQLVAEEFGKSGNGVAAYPIVATTLEVAKLISDQYIAAKPKNGDGIEAVLQVYVGEALSEIETALENLPGEFIKAWDQRQE